MNHATSRNKRGYYVRSLAAVLFSTLIIFICLMAVKLSLNSFRRVIANQRERRHIVIRSESSSWSPPLQSSRLNSSSSFVELSKYHTFRGGWTTHWSPSHLRKIIRERKISLYIGFSPGHDGTTTLSNRGTYCRHSIDGFGASRALGLKKGKRKKNNSSSKSSSCRKHNSSDKDDCFFALERFGGAVRDYGRRFPGVEHTRRFVLQFYLPSVVDALIAKNKSCFVDFGHHTVILEGFHLSLARALPAGHLHVVRIMRRRSEVRASYAASRGNGPCSSACVFCLCPTEVPFCSRFAFPNLWQRLQAKAMGHATTSSVTPSKYKASNVPSTLSQTDDWWQSLPVESQFEAMITEVECRFQHFVETLRAGSLEHFQPSKIGMSSLQTNLDGGDSDVGHDDLHEAVDTYHRNMEDITACTQQLKQHQQFLWRRVPSFEDDHFNDNERNCPRLMTISGVRILIVRWATKEKESFEIAAAHVASLFGMQRVSVSDIPRLKHHRIHSNTRPHSPR